MNPPGERIVVHCPADGRQIGTVPDLGADEIGTICATSTPCSAPDSTPRMHRIYLRDNGNQPTGRMSTGIELKRGIALITSTATSVRVSRLVDEPSSA